ncbi:MAG TPA: tetratricopeptide repeat protein [Vicinamibacterales bacterium]|nr:tetratricopeptide repeat protein [Vicinamibacterales bacterium]
MPVATFGPFRFDVKTGELRRAGVHVKLQPQPARLLGLLIERAGELVTREEIRGEMWGADTFVDFDQGVNFGIRQIRSALHDNANRPCYLETLPRRGYRFIAPVQYLAESPEEFAAPPALEPHRVSWRQLVAAPLILAALVVLGGDGMAHHARRTPTPPPAGSQAHQQVELGRFFLAKGGRADVLTALELFQAALREDSRSAAAYAGLADAYNQLGTVFVAGQPPGNVRLLALRAATQAVQIDPNLAQAYAVLGDTALHELDWSRADAALRRSIALDDKSAPAHQSYAIYLVTQRRSTEAIAEARRAVELEPTSLRARHTLGWMLYFNRDYEDAVRELQTALRMDRTYARGRWRLGQVLLVMGRFSEAVETLETAVEESERAPAALGLLAMAYGGQGRRAEAQVIVDELEERSGAQIVPPGAMVLAYLGIGDSERALDALDRVYAELDGYAIFVEVDPLMDSLRTEPRYQALCRQILLGAGQPDPPSESLALR